MFEMKRGNLRAFFVGAADAREGYDGTDIAAGFGNGARLGSRVDRVIRYANRFAAHQS
jgi:hypothetical protein